MIAAEALSDLQRQALDSVRSWLDRRDRPWYYLAGYAGTGKTTVARHLAPDGSLFAAFTGKAAHVMHRAGCQGATTIHRLIYTAVPRSTQRLHQLEQAFDEAPEEERQRLHRAILAEKRACRSPGWQRADSSPVQGAPLVVVDEVSMVGERMAVDLMSYGTPVLVLGDPAQLPPVAGAGYFTRRDPDFLLTEVHRQAAESPVLRMATAIRAGECWESFSFSEASVTLKERVTTTDLLGYDQVLCGRNATRRMLNRKMRAKLGRTRPEPEAGDRLVCLRNDRDYGLLNGSTWTVEEADPYADVVHLVARSDDQDRLVECAAHRAPFLGEDVDPRGRRDYQEFDFGYALTVHKAQGSQWGSVLVVDESDCFRSDARRWLYTAVTRAAERVTVVR